MKKVVRGVALTLLSVMLSFDAAFANPFAAYGAEYETVSGSADEFSEKTKEVTWTEESSGDASSIDVSYEESEDTSDEASDNDNTDEDPVPGKTDDLSLDSTAGESSGDDASGNASSEDAGEAASEEASIEEDASGDELVGESESDTNKIGSQVTFAYDEQTGEVKIEGRSTIPDYSISGKNASPLASLKNVKTITVGEGITQLGAYSLRVSGVGDGDIKINLPSTLHTIGRGAMDAINGKVDVTIPAGAENINGEAFQGSFRNIVFEEGIKKIQDGIFEGCTLYGELKLPESLETIEDRGVEGMHNLGELTLPRNLKTIGDFAFINYRGKIINFTGDLPEIGTDAFKKTKNGTSDSYKEEDYLIGYYPADNETWTDEAVEGLRKRYPEIDFRKAGVKLVSGKCGEDITWAYNVADKTLKLVGSGDMYNYSANHLPGWTEYRKEIGRIVIDDNITSIGDFAFYNVFSDDDAINKKASLTVSANNKLTRIGSHAFFSTYFMNPNLFKGVLEIGDYAFYRNKSYSYTGNCSINADIISIGDYAFENCEYLRLVIPKFTKLTRIGPRTFADCKRATGSLELSDTITYIGEQAFFGCENIESDLKLPKNLEELGKQAFTYCRKAGGHVVIPEKIIQIHDYMFNETAITGVTMGYMYSIGSGAFIDCKKLKEVNIGRGIENIGAVIFRGCTSLTEITIPDSVRYINFATFDRSGLKKITFSGSIPYGSLAGSCNIAMNPEVHYPRSNVDWKKYTDAEKADYLKIAFLDPVFVADGPEGKAVATFVKADDVHSIVDRQIVTLGECATRNDKFDIKDYTNVEEYYYIDGEKAGQKYSFTDPLYEDVTISVKFIKKQYVVAIFKDEDNNILYSYRLEKGKKVEEPKTHPEKPGYRFLWWYNEIDGENVAYDFDKPVMYGIELYPAYASDDGINIKSFYTYTGKPITCSDLTVYDGDDLLTLGKDYTVKYKNNTNVGTATAILTFKGKYSGTVEKSFEIRPYNLAGGEEKGEVKLGTYNLFLRYNGKVQKGKNTVKVLLDGKYVTLKEGKDYYYEYPSDDETYEFMGPYTLNWPDTYTIRICGKGNYTGSLEFLETITTDLLMSDVKVYGVRNLRYTGDEVTQDYVYAVYKNRYLLLEDEAFTTEYDHNWNAGTAYITLTAIEGSGFAGSKTVPFKITGTPISKTAIAGFEASLLYDDGRDVEQFINIYTSSKAAKEADTDAMLLEGEDADYTIEYKDNTKAGKATMIITGQGGYTGTVKKTFKITPADVTDNVTCRVRNEKEHDESILDGCNTRIVVITEKSYEYSKAGSKPAPVVYGLNENYEYKELNSTKDYTVTYGKNNKTGAGAGSFKITFKGNYKGSVSGSFDIVKADLANCNVEVSDIRHKYASGICKPKVTVKDASGKVLKAGKDYTQVIKYSDDTHLLKYDKKIKKFVDDRMVKAGTVVDLKHDIIPANTEMIAELTPLGDYEIKTEDGSNNVYLERYFKLYTADRDISKARFAIKDQTFTGKDAELTAAGDFTKASLNGKDLVCGTDFEIVGYTGNTKPGKAKVTLRGIGEYAGTATVTFNIVPKNITKR